MLSPYRGTLSLAKAGKAYEEQEMLIAPPDDWRPLLFMITDIVLVFCNVRYEWLAAF
jgi:hypothetical protein